MFHECEQHVSRAWTTRFTKVNSMFHLRETWISKQWSYNITISSTRIDLYFY